MARYRSRRSAGSRRSSTRRTYSRRASGTRRYARSASAGRGRGQTVKLIIQQAPAQMPPAGYSPGVPGTVGVAALGPAKKSPF